MSLGIRNANAVLLPCSLLGMWSRYHPLSPGYLELPVEGNGPYILRVKIEGAHTGMPCDFYVTFGFTGQDVDQRMHALRALI